MRCRVILFPANDAPSNETAAGPPESLHDLYRGGSVIGAYLILSQDQDTGSPDGSIELGVQTFAKTDVNCSHNTAHRRSIVNPPVPKAGGAPACV